MAFDISAANQQIRRLKQQSAAASHCARQLITYKKELTGAWSGVEVRYIRKAIDQQIRKYEVLSADLDRLSRDMAQAVKDILLEESAASGVM